MTLLQSFLHLTEFENPLLRTLAVTTPASFALQAAFAIPSIFAQSEKVYDLSGALTNLAVTALGLYLPSIRDGAVLPSLLSPFTAADGAAGFNWRQVVLSGAVTIWAVRLGSFLFLRILRQSKDSRFDSIRASPGTFFVAWMAQAAWISLCLTPALAVDAVPVDALPTAVAAPDLLGLSLFAGGLAIEVVADRQKARWLRDKAAKVHDEEFMTRGLWSRSRYPNYFGELTLWTGIATVSAGVLLRQPVRSALGLSPLGTLLLPYLSPAAATYILLKVSGVPLSESKYDRLYGGRKAYREWRDSVPMIFPKIF